MKCFIGSEQYRQELQNQECIVFDLILKIVFFENLKRNENVKL